MKRRKNYLMDEGRIPGEIKKQVRENKSIIYGAQSIKRQLPGYLFRDTKDYDIFSRNPKKSARQIEKKLDKSFGGDYFFVKPAMHPGTMKVKSVGLDLRKNTKDDEDVADFTKTPRQRPRTIIIDDIKYTKLSESIKDKRRSLADKESAFRHKKDRWDLNRILLWKKIRGR